MVHPLGEGGAVLAGVPDTGVLGKLEDWHMGEQEEQDHRMTVSLVTTETLLN